MSRLLSAFAQKAMAEVNSFTLPPDKLVTVGEFIEGIYLPRQKRSRRLSTVKGAKEIWRVHLKALVGSMWLRDVRTSHVQSWLDAIAQPGVLSKASLQRIRSMLSGVFRMALQLDFIEGRSPVREAEVDSKARGPIETPTYDWTEVVAIADLVPESARSVVLVAAYTALRRGEFGGAPVGWLAGGQARRSAVRSGTAGWPAPGPILGLTVGLRSGQLL